MADNPATKATPTDETGLPLAAILCIAIGGYVVLMFILIIIRQVLLQRGICRDNCGWCGKEGELQCCECCVSCAESANCCKSPNIEACLDSICPARRQMDCADIIMCQCCMNPEGGCCGSKEPLCDVCNTCCDCQCQCNTPECDTVNCCCFEISLKGGAPMQPGPPELYPGYPNPYPPGYNPPYGEPAPGGYYPQPQPGIYAGPSSPVITSVPPPSGSAVSQGGPPRMFPAQSPRQGAPPQAAGRGESSGAAAPY